MRKQDVEIGMRVVPFQKTAYTQELEYSGVWKEALSKSQEYLYAIDWDDELKCFVLDSDNINDGGNGDFFNACDFKPYVEKVEQEKFKIFITEQQIKILNAVDRYMTKYPFATEGGSEYVSQSDDPQIGAVDLACELADIYCEYNTEA